MRDDAVIQYKKFNEIDLDSPFFDSLKEAYAEFTDWFGRKGDEQALVVYDDAAHIQGFMYLKPEPGPVKDVHPPINAAVVLKVGTFKINAHGTRLGERFVKKIFDYALAERFPYVYVTVFPEHEMLIQRLETYGFSKHGIKDGPNGREDVYVKDFARLTGNICLDYPIVNAIGKRKWLLAIRPIFHSRLFPDSLLRTEDSSIVPDLSYANSIHKIYISFAPIAAELQPGDVLVIYRMAEPGKSAEYSSVASSVCVVEEIRPRSSFADERAFVSYCGRLSIFNEDELRQWFRRGGNVTAIRMTYNIALPKRPTRHILAEEVGLDRHERWTVLPLTDAQFSRILERGKIHASSVVDQA